MRRGVSASAGRRSRSFNSLFEMPGRPVIAYATRHAIAAFNSLFEMHDAHSHRLGQVDALAFNSLFEMQNPSALNALQQRQAFNSLFEMP